MCLDRIRPGRVDEVEVLEEGVRTEDLDDVLGEIELVRFGPVFEKGDAVGRGNDVGIAEVLAEERVEERGLARVDLAGDDEEEGILEIGEEIPEQGKTRRLIPLSRPSWASDSMALLNFSRVWK